MAYRNDDNQDIRLTPTEAGAHRMQMDEHRARKCGRCIGRYDLPDNGYLCQRGQDAERVMASQRPCRRFVLDEDPNAWRDDIDAPR